MGDRMYSAYPDAPLVIIKKSMDIRPEKNGIKRTVRKLGRQYKWLCGIGHPRRPLTSWCQNGLRDCFSLTDSTPPSGNMWATWSPVKLAPRGRVSAAWSVTIQPLSLLRTWRMVVVSCKLQVPLRHIIIVLNLHEQACLEKECRTAFW